MIKVKCKCIAKISRWIRIIKCLKTGGVSCLWQRLSKDLWVSKILQDLLVFYTNIYYLSNPETSKDGITFCYFSFHIPYKKFPRLCVHMFWGRDENEDLFIFIKNVIICYFHHFCWSNRNVSIIRHTFLRLYAFWKFRNLENNFNHNLLKRICQRRDIPWLKKYWKHVEELVYQKIEIGYLEYIFNFPYWLILHIITVNFFIK